MAKAHDRIPKARRHVTAVGVIVAAHVALGFWLASAPRPPSPSMPLFIAVDLVPGAGDIQGPVAVGRQSSTVPSDASSTETEPEATDKDTSVKPVEESAEAQAGETETVQSKAFEPAATSLANSAVPAPSPSSETAPSDDVLKMVEALIGTTATDVSASDAATRSELQQAWIASQPGGDGGGCELGEMIRTRLMANDVALRELSQYPVANRSVSNAIQLWNGEWLVKSNDDGIPALPAVREVISTTVTEAPEACRVTMLQGPRFVFVESPGASSLILVLGSGDWRWADLEPVHTPRLLRWFGLGSHPD